MGRGRDNPNRLLVEGKKDKFVIPYLLEKCGVPWPKDKNNAPVFIDEAGSWNELADVKFVSSNFKASGAKNIGIIVDADESADGRWQRIRQLCGTYFQQLPNSLPEEGLIVSGNSEQRLGVWIMPDNVASGMLETFLQKLIRQGSDCTLFEHAQEVCRNVKDNLGAPFKEVHFDKASLHTWLAWNDEPGPQMHEA
ncbi:MAG: hypothetical protein KDA66_09610, partial [Planctomycetaceae bacterium]|nr:hypothetical protein [Planctomycetaceae bacterium]